MILLNAFIIIPIIVILILPFLNVKWKGIILFAGLLLNAIISSYFGVQTLLGKTFEFILTGSFVTGLISLRLDALSGWFMLIINFVFLTGGFYGLFYMQTYKSKQNNLTLHGIAFILLHTTLISLCAIQNSIAFIIAWEIMALSAFICVIFDNEKTATINAGINYLIQSHVSILFLMFAFILVAMKTNSYDFSAITTYTTSHQGAFAIILFLLFFTAFAIKSGFVPFHTWLPYAHPAAPAHFSGIMSGIVIKIGIFGILRMILLIKLNYSFIGYIILIVSLISGMYGVMLAIIQHNLKKLLAYHSIENIGIIGIGIGIGCIGLGSNNHVLSTLGFAAALLHTLNHALFKSLLFYAAGNIYQATHTLNIDQLGGLIKKMPQTTLLFLIGAVAICGIPPFNGFISEFLIYSSLYHWLQNSILFSTVAIVFTILGMVLIGGLAIFCFTKAFGIVFLGNARHKFDHEVKEVSAPQLLPLYLITFAIIFIGLFPKFFIQVLEKPIDLFTNLHPIQTVPLQEFLFDDLQAISWAAMVFILIVIVIFATKKMISKNRVTTISTTWGCGYETDSPKLQYTASSFVRSYYKLAKVILLVMKHEDVICGVFPSKGKLETHPYDAVEKWVVDKPIKSFKSFIRRFSFIHNGRLQFYILYGILFIVSVICIPLIYDKIIQFIDFLKQI